MALRYWALPSAFRSNSAPLAGISSGAAVAAMLDVATRLTSGVVVTIFPDGAEKYLNESFWNVNDD